MLVLKPYVTVALLLCACTTLFLLFPSNTSLTSILTTQPTPSPSPSSSLPTPSNPAFKFKFAFFTYVASNNTKYIKWASLQALAAHTFNPDAEHNIVVASTVNPSVPKALAGLGYSVVIEEPFPEAHQHGKTWVNQLTKIKLWARTNYTMLCHLDGDVIFFTNLTKALVDECAPKLLDPAAGVDICAFENEECELADGAKFNDWNRKFWGMPYMEASIFCLRPSLETYESLLRGGVRALQTRHSVVIGNRTARTEQDFLNLYFRGRIHYMPCKGGRAGGDILHTKSVEQQWAQRVEQGEDQQSLLLYAPGNRRGKVTDGAPSNRRRRRQLQRA